MFLHTTGEMNLSCSKQAEKVIHRIENAVTSFSFLKNIHIGLSSGMAIFPEDGDTLDKLVGCS